MTEKYCPNCNEFEENMKAINKAITLAYDHGMWDYGDEIDFIYCPYCGSELKDL